MADQTRVTPAGLGHRFLTELFCEAVRAAGRTDLDRPELAPDEVRELLRQLAETALAFSWLAGRIEASMRRQHDAGDLRRPEGASVAASLSSLEAALLEAGVAGRDLEAALGRARSSIDDLELIDE